MASSRVTPGGTARAGPCIVNVLLAAGLGLLAFIEPCSIGVHLLLIDRLERLPARRRAGELMRFTLVRAAVFSLIGLAAAFLGQALFGAQRLLWIAFGLVYLGLGALWIAGRQGTLMRYLGPDPERLSARGRALGLGVAFGLYVPGCAIPLLAVLVGASATDSAAGGALIGGVATLFVFGLALSAPLFALLRGGGDSSWLDRLPRLARRAPRAAGIVLLGLGVVSIALAVTGTGTAP